MVYTTFTPQHNGVSEMYTAYIRQQDGSFYAMIVRVDRDGQESVIHGYKSRFFATRKAAEKSTSTYIAKIT